MIKRFTQKYSIAAALITGCFFVLSCENNIRDVEKLNKKAIGVEEAKNIESFLSQEGKVKAKLMAPVMLRYLLDTPKVVFPKTLKVQFFDDSTKVESNLFSKYGHFIENESKVYLRDSVIVYNRSGDTLICHELYWDQVKAIFYTEKNVIIKKPDQKVYGSGLIADQGFKWFTIKHPHNSFLKIPDSSFIGD